MLKINDKPIFNPTTWHSLTPNWEFSIQQTLRIKCRIRYQSKFNGLRFDTEKQNKMKTLVGRSWENGHLQLNEEDLKRHQPVSWSLNYGLRKLKIPLNLCYFLMVPELSNTLSQVFTSLSIQILFFYFVLCFTINKRRILAFILCLTSNIYDTIHSILNKNDYTLWKFRRIYTLLRWTMLSLELFPGLFANFAVIQKKI